MNPQPDSFTTNCFSIGFVCLVLYFAATTKKRHFLSNDLVEILYEVPQQQIVIEAKPVRNQRTPKVQPATKPVVVPKPVPQQVIQPIVKPEQPKPQPKPKLTKNTFTPLHEDCVNALMSLGMKKKEAVSTVIDVFTKNDITSIEDFIRKAFVPNEYYRPST